VLHTVASVDAPGKAQLLFWKLLATGDGTFQHVDRAAPNMEVLELGAGPCLATKQLKRAASRVISRNAVEDMDGVQNCKWPKLNIGNVWPMDSRMVEHCMGDGKYGTNGALGNAVGVVGSNPRVTNGLMKLLKMLFKGRAGKQGAVITEVGLCHNSMLRAMLLKGLLGQQSLMEVKASLQLNQHQPCGMVHKDAAFHVLLVGAFLAVGMDQASKELGVEVVN